MGCGASAPAQPAERVPARVTKHTDGDTLWLSGIGKVRLIGVDTPEVYGAVECYGREASAFVKRLLPLGSRVRYSLDLDERDRYGRALAYVYTDDGRFRGSGLAARGEGENEEYRRRLSRSQSEHGKDAGREACTRTRAAEDAARRSYAGG